MPCARCGALLLEGKRFCHMCGLRIEEACPSCSSPVEPGYRFCPDCGTRLERSLPAEATPVDESSGASAGPGAGGAGEAPLVGERKLVTVLFCDLVGSTALAEKLDPEEYRDLLDQYFEIALAAINRLDGFTTQLAGDGVMALFGAPIAHEDAPQRAVRAALEIFEGMGALNERLRASDGVELQARIGLHTGPVVVGVVGDEKSMSYTAIGDTTNLAARLQSLARPGSILISDATCRLIRGFFDVEAIGPLQVRGKAEPVDAYEVVGMIQATPIGVARARGLTPFVGRRNELRLLRECLDRLDDDAAQIVAVVGEAGSGKSRLLYEFRRSLADRPVAVFEARCSALTQAVPYGPFVAMLRRHFGISAEESPERSVEKLRHQVCECGENLRDSFPYLGRLLSLPVDSMPDVPADELRRETFEAVAQVVLAESIQQPVLMFLEDLQWMDESSREMLEMAMSHIRSGRIMLVLTYRPDYQPSWRTRAALSQVNLPLLDAAETREMIRGVLGAAVPLALEERIRERAEGNPLFTEELARALLEQGQLVPAPGGLRLRRSVEEIRIPDTVHEVIAARLDRLPRDVKRTVQVAAVLGRQFGRAMLESLVDEGANVAAALLELEQRGLIHRKNLLSDEEFRFGESLVQEVAYEGLLLRERRKLHQQVARRLEERGEQRTPEGVALIAHHYSRSDDRMHAVQWMMRAGQEAERLPSYPAAIRFFRDAWKTADALTREEPGRAEVARLAMQAAMSVCRLAVFYGSSESEGSEEAAIRGRELAIEMMRWDDAASFLAFRGFIRMGGRRDGFADGLRFAEEAFAEVQRGGWSLLAMNMSRGLAYGYLNDGRLSEAQRMFDDTVRELERAGESNPPSDIYLGARLNREQARVLCGYFADSETDARAGYALAVQVGNRTVQSALAGVMATVELQRGNDAEARGWADRGLEVAESIGNVASIRTNAIAAAGSRQALGEPVSDRLLDLIEQGFAARGDMAMKCLQAVDVLLSLDEGQRARRFAEVAWEHAGGRFREAICRVALGEVLLRIGSGEEVDEGRGQVESGLRLACELEATRVEAAARTIRAEDAVARGDGEEAQGELRRAASLCEEMGLRRLQRRLQALQTVLPGDPFRAVGAEVAGG